MSELLALIAARRADLAVRIAEHLALAGSACGAAVLAGIPLGITILRRKWLGPPILGLAGTVQTIPSLAMLALMQVWIGGIGFMPAFAALFLYALLPIVRNTHTGLTGIDPGILEAADGLGYTSRQRLWKVELPLAAPVIMAGVRTATVITVGVATLSTYIGAGGLGEFINRGLSMNNGSLIVMGCMAASVLALSLDLALGFLERYVKKKLRLG